MRGNPHLWKRRKPLRLYEPGPDRPARYIHAVAQAELAEHAALVALDGLRADHERVGDLARAVALGHELRHLALAGGQRGVTGAGARRLRQPAAGERGAAGGDEIAI